jgi:hypothetical protein
LNVPYHGGDKSTRYALDDNGNKLSLEEFFKVYDQKVLTEKELINGNYLKQINDIMIY